MKALAIVVRRILLSHFRKVSALVLGFTLVIGIVVAWHSRAHACASCACISANHEVTRAVIRAEHGAGVFYTDPESLALVTAHMCDPGTGTRGWIAYEMCRHREEFIVFYWFKEHILAAMMMMTEQLVSSAMNQMFILGAFFDAEQQLETQRLFQELTAEAHKDYHVSYEMCEIGTLARSLAATQRQGEFNAHALSQHMQDRQMRNLAMSSGAGKGLDITQRWEQFRARFCVPEDNNAELGPRTPTPICQDTTGGTPRNLDADWTDMVGYPNTITVDFSDTQGSQKEEAIFALASNLYGHDVFEYFPEAYFKNEANQDDWMYMRSIVAKRSVAQNSFNAIIGLKAQGKAESEQVMPYMEKVLEQLGITDRAQRLQILGGTLGSGITPGMRPSYYAQMELLTKKLYQRPEFFTSLYDKPANVDRKKAAMRALGLAQNMDLFKSKLRTEAALAVLTELEIHKAQERLQDRMNEAVDTGVE